MSETNSDMFHVEHRPSYDELLLTLRRVAQAWAIASCADEAVRWEEFMSSGAMDDVRRTLGRVDGV